MEEDFCDPITKEWFLIRSWKPTIFILSAYIWFVLKAGPHFMKDRQPFSLSKIIITYNIFQVFANLHYIIVALPIIATYDIRCQTADFSLSPPAVKLRNAIWYFLITKYIDLFDTVFFVLRKKSSQITFLHVFHHSFTPVYVALIVKYHPGGIGVIFGFMNSTIHVFMYSYYALSALGPRYQKYLWWKKYLTQMQMIQFLLMLAFCGPMYFRECDYPMWLVNLHVSVATWFLCLFGNFYYKAYCAGKKKEDRMKN